MRQAAGENTGRHLQTVQGARHFWKFRTPDHELARQIAGALELPPLVALLLTMRRITSPSDARDFLFHRLQNLPSPHRLSDLDKAVRRIKRALEQGEYVAVYGDYDVDGLTATALLVDFLSRLGGKVSWYVPHRLQEGYGLNQRALQNLYDQGVRLVITVDCGTSDHEALGFARQLGLDVIVTDHHQPTDRLAEATALINPKQGDGQHEHRDLAGVGVAFYLATGLRAHLRRSGWWTHSDEPNLKDYLDWVALGTLADMVPLTSVNRILAGVGLQVLSGTYRLGLQALKEISGLEQSQVSDWDILFRLGPKLNAAGRLGKADLALQLLLSPDHREARRLARELEQLNRERQAVENQLLSEALALIQADDSLKESCTLVLASSAWHKGLLGLVASRLVERFNKPTILLTRVDQHWEGSGRSPRPVDLHRALSRCKEYLVRFGGHRLAAGLRLRSGQLHGFRAAFEKTVQSEVSHQADLRVLEVNLVARLGEITPGLMAHLQLMQPFGEGNPEPAFCCQDFEVEDLRVLKGRHLRLRLRQGPTRLSAIGFDLLDSNQVPPRPERLIFRPRWNHWHGARRLQLHILDYC